MKRRRLIHYAGAGFLASLGLGVSSTWQQSQAQSRSVTLRWLGHTCFLATSGNQRLLINPFRPIGCTAGYGPVTVTADLVMISSRLFDEGYLQDLPNEPRVLAEPGSYTVGNLTVQGIQGVHDREGGRRFGRNIVWKWNQGGFNLVHMGGAVAPVTIEDQILIGRPDVLMVPVGGGPKAYTPQEAVQAVQALNPKLVIPTHYRTAAAAADSCDLVGVEEFLEAMAGTPVTRSGSNTFTVTDSLPETTRIQVLSV